MIYIFDVDGTLTEPSKPMEKDFQNFFIEWAGYNNFVVVSGERYTTIERQLGKTIISMSHSVFPYYGLVQYQGFVPVWEHDCNFIEGSYNSLDKYLIQSDELENWGKHKILDHLTYDDEFTFFGDKTNVDGDDYGMYRELKNRYQTVYEVRDYKHTEQILKGLFRDKKWQI